MRISYEEMKQVFKKTLLKKGFLEQTAELSSTLFAQNSLDGVYSHGVNRFPRVISYIEKGYINPKAVPTKIDGIGGLERWNGNLGMGNSNAKICMDRAIELAKQNGLGCVALQNTNHWMRGGAYGWQAADNGCIGICWTNTQPNMPAWGAKDRRIGNNPLIISIPKSNGKHVVLDCAMSQFSYGKIEQCELNSEQLPVPGGFDSDGNITKDPSEITKTWRVLPIGYWKGSGISIALDLVATVLSGGLSTSEIGKLGGDEYKLSQFLLAIDPSHFNSTQITDSIIDTVLSDIASSEMIKHSDKVLYPGERSYAIRSENLKSGIPVHDNIWNKILSY